MPNVPGMVRAKEGRVPILITDAKGKQMQVNTVRYGNSDVPINNVFKRTAEVLVGGMKVTKNLAQLSYGGKTLEDYESTGRLANLLSPVEKTAKKRGRPPAKEATDPSAKPDSKRSL